MSLECQFLLEYLKNNKIVWFAAKTKAKLEQTRIFPEIFSLTEYWFQYRICILNLVGILTEAILTDIPGVQYNQIIKVFIKPLLIGNVFVYYLFVYILINKTDCVICLGISE